MCFRAWRDAELRQMGLLNQKHSPEFYRLREAMLKELDAKAKRCPKCGGSGKKPVPIIDPRPHRTPWDDLLLPEDYKCSKCRGTGHIKEEK